MSINTIVGGLLRKLVNCSGITEQNAHLEHSIAHLRALMLDRFDRIEHRDKQRPMIDQVGQKLLAEKYRERAGRGDYPSFDEVEFVNFSQNGEDGILHYIFSLVGTTNKFCAEFCAGDGRECNSANLIINDGWHGLLCDGDEKNVQTGQYFFYKTPPNTYCIPPHFVCEWVTAENINRVLDDAGFAGEIDLLSIDVDGIDYRLWKAIDRVSPRVVVVEVNAAWGHKEAMTVPYRTDFVAQHAQDGQRIAVHGGASIAAFVKLAKQKGYRLVGSNRYGFNIFFIRNDVGEKHFPEITPAEFLPHPVARWNYERVRPMLDDFEWHEVK